MSIDDEFQKMLGAKAAAAQQLQSEMANLATMLGQFNALLRAANFTTEGAEKMVLEWFVALLEAQPSSDDE